MRHKHRVMTLVAASLLPGACSAAERTGNAAAAGDGNIATAPLDNRAPEHEIDARTGPAMT